MKGGGSFPDFKLKSAGSCHFEYRLIGLESGPFLRGDYKITQRWAKVFLKALVERENVMVEAFYMISIPKI